jgi:excisionase family DNA binding protein
MKNDKRPLFTLTVEEFVELNQSMKTETYNSSMNSQRNERDKPDIIYVDEVVALTGYTRKTIYTKVSRSEMPVISSGRPLTFSRKQLNEWMAKGRPSIAEMIADDYMNNKNQRK